MTKANKAINRTSLSIAFWAVLSLILIRMGIDGVRDAVMYGSLDEWTVWGIPVIFIIFGSMILGVVINKFSNLLKSNKRGKGKK